MNSVLKAGNSRKIICKYAPEKRDVNLVLTSGLTFFVVTDFEQEAFRFSFVSFKNSVIGFHFIELFFRHAGTDSMKLLFKHDIAPFLSTIMSSLIWPIKNQRSQGHYKDGQATVQIKGEIGKLFKKPDHNSTSCHEIDKCCQAIKLGIVLFELATVSYRNRQPKKQISTTFAQSSSGSIGGTGMLWRTVIGILSSNFPLQLSAKSSFLGVWLWLLSFSIGCGLHGFSFLSSDIELSPVPLVLAGGDKRSECGEHRSAPFSISEFGEKVTDLISSFGCVWSDSNTQEGKRRGVEMGQPSILTPVTPRHTSRVSQTCEASLQLAGRFLLPVIRPASLFNEVV